jgi:polysaccharide export outer membrane protein
MMWIYRTGKYLTGLALALALVSPNVTAADAYVIGAEDVLDISFWQAPERNLQVRVGLDGRITIDIIGQITAAGKTTEQLQNDIVRDMSRLDKAVSQAAVRVVEYNHNYVFVIGQVNQPGKRSFEQIPDLWTLLNEAGGVAPQGDLSRVTILRGGAQAGRVEVVNVSEAIATGRLDQLPKIGRQDTIELPRMPGAVFGADLGRTSEQKNLIYVIGAVNTPGPITYEHNIDIAEALAMANGPTMEADVKNAQLIIKDGYYSQTVKFDLEAYSRSGQPARYMMQKEDMIVVPYRRSGFHCEGIGGIAAPLGMVTTAILIYDRVTED